MSSYEPGVEMRRNDVYSLLDVLDGLITPLSFSSFHADISLAIQNLLHTTVTHQLKDFGPSTTPIISLRNISC